MDNYPATGMSRGDNRLVEIGRGLQARVELDPGSMLLCKTFNTDDPRLAAKQATQEFRYLQAYSRALINEPFVRCPRPIRLEAERGRFWMTLCEGRRVDRILLTLSEPFEQHFEHIATQAALGLETYIRVFDEPYLDFQTANLLYDIDSRMLTVIDLAHIGWTYSSFDHANIQYEISLGNFAAYTTRSSLTPGKLANRVYWRRQTRLWLSLIRTIGSRHTVRPDLIRRVQREKFNSFTVDRHILIKFWYHSIGKLLYTQRVNSLLATLESDVQGHHYERSRGGS
jgi:hypothetical protein